jgi:hypothetical protein
MLYRPLRVAGCPAKLVQPANESEVGAAIHTGSACTTAVRRRSIMEKRKDMVCGGRSVQLVVTYQLYNVLEVTPAMLCCAI